MNKKRVLFVDDEAMVLQGLQRMLRPMRNDWEMAFTDSGAKALELMAQAPFDVVVSDMRMPGMNGAELLNAVMKRYPATVRLILSGHADQDLILKCVGFTHQYLAKPCDPEALKDTVRYASALDQSLQNETLRRLASQMERLPSLPSLYIELVEKLQHPDVSIEDVAQTVARDIGMTAKILKLVNSAFFGLPHRVASPMEAVAYLGVDTIKSLALSIHAFSQYETAGSDSAPLDGIWNHSLQVGSAARAISQLERLDTRTSDECFVAGLLHDTGKLILAGNFPDLYKTARQLAAEDGCDIVMAEQQVFRATHAEVGGYLLGLWGLPVPIVEAIALHHAPAQSLNPAFSPLTAVHAANAIVLESQGGASGSLQARLDLDYLTALGLNERVPEWRDAVAGNAIAGMTL